MKSFYVKFCLVFLILLFSSVKLHAEFQKEIKLIDAGKCEEALEENRLTSIEQEKKFDPKNLFTNKHVIKVLRNYSLNRKFNILKNNCKRLDEAFLIAKESLNLELKLYQIPANEFDESLNYTNFYRTKNLADAYSRVADFYIDNGDFDKGIDYYKKNIELYESIDLFNKDNLLNYNYSILSGIYNRAGNLKKASEFKIKHLEYLGKRFGDKTNKYFDALFEVYYQYYDQGYYDFALQTVLEIRKSININNYYQNDSFGELKLNHEIATIYYLNFKYDESINTHKKNLEFIRSKKKLPNTSEVSKKLIRWEVLILNDMALSTASKFDLTANIEFLNQAEKIYLEVLQIAENSQIEQLINDNFITKDNLAGIYSSKSEFDKALVLVKESYTDCIKIEGQESPRCLGQLISYANLEYVFDIQKGIELLEKFLKLEIKTNQSFIRQRVNARASLSVMYADLGNIKKSEELMLEAVNLIDPADTRFRDVYVLTMNNYYLQMGKTGNSQGAINGYLELINFINVNFGENSNLKIEILNNLGFLSVRIGDKENGSNYYLKAREFAKKFNTNRTFVTSTMNLADIHYSNGDIEKSNSLYKEALEYIQSSTPLTKILLFASLSKTESFLGNETQALKYGLEGLEIAKNFHGVNHPSNLQILDSLALANGNNNNEEAKFKNLSDIYNIISDYSKGYLTENFNADPNEYFQQIYSFLYIAANRDDNNDEHLRVKEYFEKNSYETIDDAVFNLTETLRTTKVTVNTNKMLQRNFFEDESKQKKLRDLEKKIDQYSKIPKYASDQKEKKKIASQVEKLRNEIEELKNELDLGKLIKGDSFIYQNIKFDDIQKSLSDDQAILYYVSYPNNIYYGVVTKDKSEFKYKYSIDEKILPLIKNIRNSINYKNGALTEFDFNSSYELYGELIEPFYDYISDKKDLIIVPHGSLLSIPFEILVDQIPQNKSLQNENWLIKKYNITYFPSISSYHAMKKLKKIEFKNHFAGFGDPKLSKTNKKIVSNKKLDLNKIFLRGGLANVDEIRQFAELPKTANELKLVSSFFDKKDIFLRENFNEKKIKSINLKDYTVLSFATHGIVANEISGAIEPGLITSPPTKGTLEDDGVLNTSEIKNLDLNAELVILSACNTAAGDGSSSAEGLSGLTSAFFYAGARSLLVSHWYVEDESTVNLMTQTFSNLGKNSDFSEALRNSKLSMIENQETSHPIFWAPFVLVGGST